MLWRPKAVESRSRDETSGGEHRCTCYREVCLPRDHPRPKKGSFLPDTTLIGGRVWRDSAKDYKPERKHSGLETVDKRQEHLSTASEWRYYVIIWIIYRQYVRYAVCFVNLFLPSCLMSSVFSYLCAIMQFCTICKSSWNENRKVLISSSFPY